MLSRLFLALGLLAGPLAAAESAPAFSAEDARVFFAGFLQQQMEKSDLAGVTISVANRDGTLWAQGFGYADYAGRVPVDPATTLFRPASISKLFTALAVMQLVEEGKLALDQDVNGYLDFKIPATFPEPVTLRQILTHTAGFEETYKYIFSPTVDLVRPLKDFLPATIPARIYHPGTVTSYSNWALELAGYIVERARGEAFHEVVRKRILEPLRMTRTTFAQPVPATLGTLSAGYRIASARANSFEFMSGYPAGGLTTTAEDMARFGRALLRGGELDGARIIQAETLQKMMTRTFDLHPAVNGMGLGFIESSNNGRRIWSHGGATFYFFSEFMVLPDEGIAFFVSYNSRGKIEPRPSNEIRRAFLDRYFPGPPPPAAAKADPALSAALAGTYETTRRGQTNFTHLFALQSQFDVTADPDGSIRVAQWKDTRGQVRRWLPVEPRVYADSATGYRIAFRGDGTGPGTELTTTSPIALAQKRAWYDSRRFWYPTLSVSLGILLLTFFGWPVAAIARRRYSFRLHVVPGEGAMHVLSRLATGVILFFIAAFYKIVFLGGDSLSFFSDEIHGPLTILRAAGWAALGGGAVILVSTLFLVFRGAGRPLARLVQVALCLAATAILIFAWKYHVLGIGERF